MRLGGWVPISKKFVKELPKDRPYSTIEAAFSLQVDYDKNNKVTVSGYANLWQWSRKKVRNFLKRMSVEIIYDDDTQHNQNQRGQIRVQIRDRSEEKKGQIRLIDSNDLQTKGNRYDEQKGQIRDRSGTTTRILDPDTKNKSTSKPIPFDQILGLWSETLPELPQPRELTEPRKKQLQARWNSRDKSSSGLRSDTLEFWEGFFKYIRRSDFLMGRKDSSRGTFRVSFDWVIKKSNFQKILEGNYDN